MSSILIVQDDDSVQDAMRRPLERAGHRVVMLAEPLHALDLLESPNIHFDLIIADVASFRYAHHQHTLGLLHRRATALGTLVLPCTTRGELRLSGRYSDLPNPLLTTRFLRLVNSLLGLDVSSSESSSSSLRSSLPEVAVRLVSSK